MVALSGASLPPHLSNIRLNIAVAGQKFEQDFAPTPNLGYSFVWDGKDSLGRLVSGRQAALVNIGYDYPLVYTNPPNGNWHSTISFGDFPSSVTLSGVPGRAKMTASQDLPVKDTTIGTYLAKGAGLGAWTLDANHLYDFGGVLWRGDGERESAPTRMSAENLIVPGCHTSWLRIAPASDGSLFMVDSDCYGSILLPQVGQIWRFYPATGTHTLFLDYGLAPQFEISTIATAPDDTVYYPILLPIGSTTPSLYINHAGPKNTLLGSWMVEASPAQVGDVLAIAVGPDGTPYYLDKRGTCLRLMKLEADGRTLQVAGGDCTNQVASGDGGLASAATFKAIGGDTWTPPADLAVGKDGSVYVANQSECRVRRVSPNGIITTFAGSTCPTAGKHTGDGGPATSALMKPLSIAIDRDDTLFIADYDYWEVQCSTRVPTPGCYALGSDTWMEPRSEIRLVRNGLIEAFAGTSTVYGPPHSPALQRPLHILTDLVVGADRSLYYAETFNGQTWGGYNTDAPVDWPYGLRHIQIPMPGVPQTAAIQLASQYGPELYGFDAQGQHLTTQDTLTGATRYQFGYDASGRLATITDANALVTRIERDSESGQATAIVASNGQRTELTMTDGYLTAIDEPGGAHREFTYDGGGLLKSYKKPNQATSSFTYDDMGRLVHEDRPGGGSWTLTRTGPTPQNPKAALNVAAVSAEGKVWTCNGVTDDVGNETHTNSGPSGLQTTRVTTQDGMTTWSTPDGMTQSVAHAADPRFGIQSSIPASIVSKTPAAKQMTTTMSRAVTLGTDGSTLVSQVDTTAVNGKVSTSTYSVAAKTVTNQSPVGRQTVSTLDAQGRVVQVQAGNLAPTAYAYDNRGRLSTVTVGSGTTARVTSFSYDDLDRLSSVTDPLSRVQSYRYDDANRVVAQVFTDGSEVGFSYDANGNVTSVTPPSRPEHDFGYTPADLMSSYTPPVVSGTGATTYEYNRDKQPTVVHRPDGSQIVTTYDSAGRVATTTYPAGPSTSDGNITVTRNYHPTTGNLSGMTASDGQTLAYSYDGNLPLSTTWSGTVAGSVSRTYDNNFRVASESVNGANTVARGYDDDGLLTSVDGLAITRDATNGLISDTTLGSVTNHRTYDAFGRIATYEAKFGATSLYSVVYTRDSLGRVETKTEAIQGTTTSWAYSYDSDGRLWQVMRDGLVTAVYAYDSNGNRLSRTTPTGTETGTYDDQDRLLTYGKWAYTYTANGELRTKTDTTNGTVTSFTYDGQGNLRRVALPDGRVIEYVIDGENRRVGKKINGTLVRRWLYRNQLKPAAEFDGAGTLLSRYADGLVIKGSNTYRVVADQLGTPRLLIDRASGAVAQRLDLDEFGMTENDTNPGFQVLGFAGGIYDPDTRLIRFGARDYDPEMGRWTAKDPIRFEGGQGSLYVYVMNDPINNRDPGGLGLIDMCKRLWAWLSGANKARKANDMGNAMHKSGKSGQECNKAQEELMDKLDDGTATDEDNDAMENACGQSMNDLKDAIKSSVGPVTDSYKH